MTSESVDLDRPTYQLTTRIFQAFARQERGYHNMSGGNGTDGYNVHPNVPSVDQSDRTVPFNLRQSGSTPMQLLISTRVRKSPFWHLSIEAGAWRATVYNRMYHPRGYHASLHAESVWYGIRGPGARFGLRVIAPAHHRRIAAGILSWGQDMDVETSPFQVNLAYQVPRTKTVDYIGKAALEHQRELIETGHYPFQLKLVGMKLGGQPITDYAPDFWLIREPEAGRVGYVTSPWWSPELKTNIALGYVPWRLSGIDTELKVELPEIYSEVSGQAVDARVASVPFRPSANPSIREQENEKGQEVLS